MAPKGRRWLATSFNFGELETLEHRFDTLDAHIRYVCWGAETCPDTGRRHVHFYLRLDQPTTRGRIQALIGDDKADCELCKGSEKENHDYVFKDESRLLGPWEKGRYQPESEQGKRSDLEMLAEGIKAGKTNKQLCEEFPTAMLRYTSHVDKFRMASMEATMRDDIQVLVCVGPTDIGKTHWAFQTQPGIFPCTWDHGMLRFDRYAGQKAILIDEFTGQIPIEELLRILDKWPIYLNVKYGNTPALWDRVWISSNVMPENWYKLNSDLQKAALMRRLTHIVSATTREELEAKILELGKQTPQ